MERTARPLPRAEAAFDPRPKATPQCGEQDPNARRSPRRDRSTWNGSTPNEPAGIHSTGARDQRPQPRCAHKSRIHAARLSPQQAIYASTRNTSPRSHPRSRAVKSASRRHITSRYRLRVEPKRAQTSPEAVDRSTWNAQQRKAPRATAQTPPGLNIDNISASSHRVMPDRPYPCGPTPSDRSTWNNRTSNPLRIALSAEGEIGATS